MTTTEQLLNDLITEQAQRISELETQNAGLQRTLTEASKQRAKMIIQLTDHVPVNDVLAQQQNRISALENGIKKALAIMEKWHSEGFVVIRDDTGELVEVSRLRNLIQPAARPA